VWVGGAHVASHEGGYTPFGVDVTDFLGDDGADLVVRADDDPLDLEAPRGKQDWQDEPHAIWYPRTTGIWRTVWLEHVAPRRIAEVQWRGDPRTMRLSVRVQLAVPVSGVRLHLRLRAGERLLVDDSVRVDGRVVERTVQVGDGGIDDRSRLLWWPGPDPVLLDAELRPGRRRRRGARRGGELHGAALGRGRRRAAAGQRPAGAAAAGARPGLLARHRRHPARRRGAAARPRADPGAGLHRGPQAPEDRGPALSRPRRPDGLLVWARCPSAYRPGPTASARLLREWADVLVAHRGFPSVVAWVPLNESWGVQEAEVDERQRGLIRALAATADALDGTRPVSANDGWETLGGDILGIHDYEQDPAVLGERYATAATSSAWPPDAVPTGTWPTSTRRASRAGPSSSRSSAGWRCASPEDEGWGYADATSPEDLLARYRAQWAAVHGSTALAGACWTQLTDTYQEVNGPAGHGTGCPRVDIERSAPGHPTVEPEAPPAPPDPAQPTPPRADHGVVTLGGHAADGASGRQRGPMIDGGGRGGSRPGPPACGVVPFRVTG
jgi:hypothetical protein